MFSDEYKVCYTSALCQKTPPPQERDMKKNITDYETPSQPDEFRTASLYFLDPRTTMND